MYGFKRNKSILKDVFMWKNVSIHRAKFLVSNILAIGFAYVGLGCEFSTQPAKDGESSSSAEGTTGTTDIGSITSHPGHTSEMIGETDDIYDGDLPGCGDGIPEKGTYCFQHIQEDASKFGFDADLTSRKMIGIEQIDADFIPDLVVLHGGYDDSIRGVYVYKGDIEGKFDGLASLIFEIEAPEPEQENQETEGESTTEIFEEYEDWPFYSMELGDFDGDGDVDIGLLNDLDQSIRIRLNDGQGNFGMEMHSTIQSQYRGVVPIDLNGDQSDDFALLRRTEQDPWQEVWEDSLIDLYINDGHGSFDQDLPVPLLLPKCFYITDLEVARVDQDDFDDMIIMGQCNKEDADVVESQLLILLGTGEPGLPLQIQYPLTEEASHFSRGDFNGDGIVDIVTIGSENEQTPCCSIRILQGKGNGEFQNPIHISIEIDYEDVSWTSTPGAIDLDGDLVDDWIFSWRYKDPVSLFPKDIGGQFVLFNNQLTAGELLKVRSFDYQIYRGIKDLNLDGFDDVLNIHLGSYGPPYFSILHSNP